MMKYYVRILALSIGVFLFNFSPLFGEQVDRPLKINLFIREFPYGFSKDRIILVQELTKLGHEVHCYHNPSHSSSLKWPEKDPQIQKADINIFVEDVKKMWIDYADKNYFIPNAEYCRTSLENLLACDIILCRTRDCEQAFSNVHPHLYYLSFTSEDHFIPNVEKDYYLPFHSCGASPLKGTQNLAAVWGSHPEFPILTLVRASSKKGTKLSNIHEIREFVPLAEFSLLQNQHGLHLCPSRGEGFGHYILEAMSTGAVVITTNAPPMNEYIKDRRFLVKTCATIKNTYGHMYDVDQKDLEKVITRVLSMSHEELEAAGKANRDFFLKKREDFYTRLEALFGTYNKPEGN